MSDVDARRRELMLALAALPAGVLTAAGWAPAAAEELGLVAAEVCLLTPETTAGPYYVDPRLVRQDITEGRPGVPLDVVLQLVDASCRPLPEVRVDVWHCDASGNYSGFARQGSDRTLSTEGETFLRGTQVTDGTGVVRFRTIWPGWYRGRTPHIHYRVMLDERTMLTSQLFFPDGSSERVFRAPIYAERAAGQDTDNSNDGIARRAGRGAFARVVQADGGWNAALVVGVDPEA